MNRLQRVLVVVGTLASVSACSEQTPTSGSSELLRFTPTTVEVQLPWDEFASGLEVHGGYGLTSSQGIGLIAHGFRATLEARTFGTWGYLGDEVQVPDSTGEFVEDDDLSYPGGRIVVYFDTAASERAGPVTVSAHRMLTDFDPRTATWTMAVDSTGDQQPWPEEGGGPAVRVAEGVWSSSDTLVLEVDSMATRIWAEEEDVTRGFRIDAESEESRVEILGLRFDFDVIASVRPDTVLERSVGPIALTYAYTPHPDPPAQGIRLSGAPAWRSVIHMQVPEVIEGPEAFCAAMGCPFQVTPQRINYAALVMRTQPSDPPAFQPFDSVVVDVRPVLAPEYLPRSPLGPPMAGESGKALSSALFATPREVSIPITAFVQAQLADVPEGSLPPPSAMVLLSFLEPASISFASFAGPGQADEPYLRLILTNAPVVQLP